jgi:hypothetical protein
MSSFNLRNAARFASICGVAGIMLAPAAARAQVVANPKAVKQAVKLDELATLKTVKQMLEAANHDYAGHRAKAVHAVHKAIQEIEHHTPKAPPNPAAAVAKANARAANAKIPPVHEAQIASDVQLRAAQELLVKVQAELATGKHPKAIAHVQLALQELQVALQIK